MKNIRNEIVLIALCLAGISPALRADTGFDAPLDTKELNLPPENGLLENKISCFYFKHFMVKQVDWGEKGAESLSITPYSPNTDKPACQKESAAHEIVIPAADNAAQGWDGYFKGAKAQFVFFGASDGFNGGEEFAVFDGRNGKKVFADVAVKGLTFAQQDDSPLTLRYDRLYAAECSVPKEGERCWKTMRSAIHMDAAAAPDCAAAYLRDKTSMAHAHCQGQTIPADCVQKEMKAMSNWDDAPSVISYPVEVADLSKPEIKPNGTKISCWESE